MVAENDCIELHPMIATVQKGSNPSYMHEKTIYKIIPYGQMIQLSLAGLSITTAATSVLLHPICDLVCEKGSYSHFSCESDRFKT